MKLEEKIAKVSKQRKSELNACIAPARLQENISEDLQTRCIKLCHYNSLNKKYD